MAAAESKKEKKSIMKRQKEKIVRVELVAGENSVPPLDFLKQILIDRKKVTRKDFP